MTRIHAPALVAAPVGFIGFIVALTLASLMLRFGLLPNDTISLWAGAILAGDGSLSIGQIVAAYPTLPFLTTAALEFITPAGAPTPSLLASALVGLLAGWWFVAFCTSGLSLIVAGAATALLAFHPVILRAAIAGPSEMMLALFLFMFANALFDLRARGAVPEVMLVAFSLAGMAFSHPIGAAIACAAVPYLVFAVRPSMVAESAPNVLLALLFPTVFSVGAFSYISWVFPGSGWSFYAAPSQSLTDWTAAVASLFGQGLTGIDTLDAALAFAFALTIAAPLALVAVSDIRHRVPLLAPALVLLATAVTAAAIAVATGWFGDPAAVALAAPVLCAVLIVRVPITHQDTGRLIGLLVLGWLGGALALALVDPRTVAAFTDRTGRADIERVAALNIGRAIAGRTGVMIDADNAPAIVIGRGNARGLAPPGDERYAITLRAGRLETPFVAVPDPRSLTGAKDHINRLFPGLYRNGAPGYRLIFENNIWRLYGRSPTSPLDNGAAITLETELP